MQHWATQDRSKSTECLHQHPGHRSRYSPIWIQTLVIKFPSQHSVKANPLTLPAVQSLKPTIFSASTTLHVPSTEMSRKLNRHERSVIRVREGSASQSGYFPLETPHQPSPRFLPLHTLDRGSGLRRFRGKAPGTWIRIVLHPWFSYWDCRAAAALGPAHPEPLPALLFLGPMPARQCRAVGSWYPEGSDDCTKGCVALQSRSREGLRHQGALESPPPCSHWPQRSLTGAASHSSCRTPHPSLCLSSLSLPWVLSNLRAHKWPHFPVVGICSLITCEGLHPLTHFRALTRVLLWGILSALDYSNDAPHPVPCCTKQG